MHPARLLREMTRVPQWHYENQKLTMAIPPCAYAFERHLNSTCDLQLTKNVVLDRGFPPVVVSPDGIYSAPRIIVNLKTSMSEFDPRINVASENDVTFARSASTTIETGGDGYHGDEVLIPNETKSYKPYISTATCPGTEAPPMCMNRPMRLRKIIVDEISPSAPFVSAIAAPPLPKPIALPPTDEQAAAARRVEVTLVPDRDDEAVASSSTTVRGDADVARDSGYSEDLTADDDHRRADGESGVSPRMRSLRKQLTSGRKRTTMTPTSTNQRTENTTLSYSEMMVYDDMNRSSKRVRNEE